jgi:hypothetical protein
MRGLTVASALLLSAMRFMSSVHDLTKDSAPSTCSLRPALHVDARLFKALQHVLRVAAVLRDDALHRAFFREGQQVFSGMVSMVSGAANADT